MTSRGGQRLASVVALCALLLVLVLLAALLFAAHLGFFETRYQNPYPENADTPSLQLQQVELVTPVKTSPPPPHEHDLLYERPPPGPQPPGEPVPLLRHHSGHFRHKMATIWDPHPQYEFTAFGRHFRLLLAHDSRFVLPDIKVTHVWENTSKLEHLGLRADGCFYSGKVQGDPLSSVAVSLCHGMTGHIRTSNGSFFIEPAEEWQDHNTVPVHRFYRVPPTSFPLVPAHHDDIDTDSMESDYPEDRRRRRKRSPVGQQEYNIEIMVVADRRMAEYHGANFTNYVLTLMATVHGIYKDASIGNPINIAVVKLFVLQDVEFATRHHGDAGISASEMLRKFCAWQQKHNDPNDDSKNHHDSALLLTRENICRNPNSNNAKCETLGLAELGTMCDKSSSCAVVQDNGLSAAYTIAHELGHVLNMPHDDDIKCEPYRRGHVQHKVMSRMLDHNTDPYAWSECSRHFLTEYLEGGYGECLLDRPGTNQLGDPSTRKQPGQDFSEDRQCELVYGPGSKICSYMPICKPLWCTTDVGEEEGCRTQHMPWADGTPCGVHQWCQRGECVPHDPMALKPINGGWGDWQGWGECSRSCGGGVKQAFRDCNSPAPANGGKYCIGRRVKYKSCNHHECPLGSQDFREEQCAAHNYNNLNIPGVPKDVKWVPKYGGIGPADRCKLYCRVAHSSAYYLLKEKVIDGTVCSPDTYDICVNGICRAAGCDHVLGSNKELDYCMECGGNNSSCQLVSGSYNTSQYGYTRVVRIPAGSSNLDVRQHGFRGSYKDDNYLALMDGETGEYILNGNSIVSMFRKVILYGGTTLEYSGSDSVVERVNSSRPLSKDLLIEVLSVGNLYPPDIKYSYTVQRTSLAQYSWRVSEQWSVCDKVCNGEMRRLLVCVKVESGQEVSSDMCNGIDKPEPPAKPCNNHCVLRWQISRSECSSHCGEGVRVLMVQCVQQFPDNKVSSVHNSSCAHLALPPTHEPCVGPCDHAHWRFHDWSPCSKSCGSGIQRRDADCVNDMNELMEEKECRESERIVERSCNTQKCPHWAVGEWAPCSVTCGTGERVRPYWCQLGNQLVTAPDVCGRDIPHHKEACRKEDCASWVVGDWSPCSVTCGVGMATRSVMCSIQGQCSSSSKPAVTDTCILHPCSLQHENAINSIDYHRYIWRTEDWQPCSVTCGEGMKRRSLVCYDEVARKVTDSNYCTHLEQPSTESGCMEHACASWRVGEWGPCSATCGQGVESRAVACMTDSREVDPRECTSSRPEDQRACLTQCQDKPPNTFKWRTGAWTECSEECGGGKRTRMVVCQDEAGVITSDVTQCRDAKPVSSITCNTQPCNHDAGWIFGAWSECNQTCGGGYQHRQVRCQSVRGTLLSDMSCPAAQKPPHVQECNTRPCPAVQQQYHYRWRSQDWSPCSRSCGKGVRRRKVSCVERLSGKLVSPIHCSAVQKPKVTDNCKLSPCPLQWIASDWSQCSVTCGHGTQQRSVACQRVNQLEWVDPDPVSPSLCDQSTRPNTSRACHPSSCYATYSWVPGPWQQCTHPCGKKGRQIRRLFCYHKTGKKVNKRNCPRELRPQRKRKCNQKKCGFTSCKDVQQKTGQRRDKEYTMSVAGRNLSIFCYGMNTVAPVEFLTLPTGERENYAEYYGNSLRNPDVCPYGGQRKEPCPCISDLDGRAGLTTFSKIRLNITSLKIISNDWTFSKQVKGARVEYGVAGDCYSRARCPQGRFSINLSGTGLRVSPHTQWRGQGHYASHQINKLEDNRKVMGKCGGYCGTCSPEFGLKLDILPP
ncbi:A disintegrin and metalloproteinase with thrombospondin motifs 20-like [Macrosteles quadrilineatus]|uniref:A disintegrin and metalloproteinase with thrombospondin motifs 20-like n=1 Tax=Macrosteles quadrilineatus TaxID=74068 RepID=UPI0023E32A21|nr:A disintegrin and metalloproteinase with thrombospondin motifs 20-like [Macrosteles quadrilineatus]